MSVSVSNSTSFQPPTWSNSSEESDGMEVIEGLPNPLRVGDVGGWVWRGYYKTKFDAVLTHREWGVGGEGDTGGANVGIYPFDTSLSNTKFDIEYWIDNGEHHTTSIGVGYPAGQPIHDIDGTDSPLALTIGINAGLLGLPKGTVWKGTLHFYIFHQGRKQKYSIYAPG